METSGPVCVGGGGKLANGSNGVYIPGADPGGGFSFRGPPNFIKREKNVTCMHANLRSFSS